jgi:membrane-associated protein
MKPNLKFLLIPFIAIFGPIMSFLTFSIFFYKSGFAITPFTPSESIFFLSGTFAASGYFNIWILFLAFAAESASIGLMYYWLGTRFGSKIFKYDTGRIFKKEHIKKIHYFYEKYGSNTILVSRFIPIVKPFIPFIAGVGKMDFLKFFIYNALGAILWVGAFIFSGYNFAKIPFVKDNFLVITEIIIVGSFILVISNLYMYYKKKK